VTCDVRRVAMCCNVLQCVACNLLQCVAMCCRMLQCLCSCVRNVVRCVAICCNVLQCVAMCCRMLKCLFSKGECVSGTINALFHTCDYCRRGGTSRKSHSCCTHVNYIYTHTLCECAYTCTHPQACTCARARAHFPPPFHPPSMVTFAVAVSFIISSF